MKEPNPPLAVITGASRGLGYALATTLAGLGWSLIIDARHEDSLEQARDDFALLIDPLATITAIPGDVADPAHRAALREAVGDRPLELLVNNASILGPSPQPSLNEYPLDVLRLVLEVNVIAPLALIQELTPALRRADTPRVVNITSDASIEPYEGWGGYGSSKAALDQLSRVWAAESPWCRCWAVDPGDMRTQMHQEAFPGEDISDRPEPETVVPTLVDLIWSAAPSGRVRLSDLAPSESQP